MKNCFEDWKNEKIKILKQQEHQDNPQIEVQKSR